MKKRYGQCSENQEQENILSITQKKNMTRWDVTYTHVFCARRKAARSVSHMFTRSDCVHTRDDTARLNYASRFVRVIYSSHIVSIKLGTVTPSVAVDWQYTNDKTVQLQWGYPHSSRRCCLAVPPALALTLPSARPQAVPLGIATPLSGKFFETMLSTPAWISFWRCNPHAPSLSMQLWQCSPHVRRR